MDSPSPPAAPDPYVTANAQAGANKEAALLTAALNRPNQYTPYGSLIWEQGAPTKSFNQQRYDEAVRAAQAAARPAAGAGGGGRQGYAGDEGTASGGYGTGGANGITDEARRAMGLPPAGGSGGGGGSSYTAPNRNDAQFWDTSPSAQWSSRIVLDPRVQAILDAQLETSQGLQGATQAALGRVQDTFSQAAPTPNDEMRQRVEDALYGRYRSRLDPQFQQQEDQIRSQLMNRGLVEGSEAWKTQMDQFGRTKNDAYSTALQDAVYRGGQEMSNLYSMEMAGRNSVLNELNALRSGQQVSTPDFGNSASGATVAPAPIGQALQNQYQGELGAYNASVAGNNATMGAGMGAMATIAAAFI